VSHKASQQPDETTRAYSVPYIIDTAPPKTMAGIRVHWPVVSAGAKNIQMIDDFKNGLCLGSSDVSSQYKVDPKSPLSPLGVSLEWAGNSSKSEGKSMVTHVVRGMPFATMQYYGGALPTIYSFNGPAANEDKAIMVDGKKGIQCGNMGGMSGNTVSVEKEMELHFINSDFTWGVFFSKPVDVSCDVSEGDEKTAEFQLSVVKYEEDSKAPLTVRLALLNQCTTGLSNIKAHCTGAATDKDMAEKYAKTLRESVSVFPTSPQLSFAYPGAKSATERTANVTIDWSAESSASDSDADSLVMFAMPHHQDMLNKSKNVEMTKQCFETFHGPTCLVRGATWTLSEDLGRPMSFNARRPPEADVIPTLASALAEDIHYNFSDNMFRAASDTYFSGKILARVGRVISIASEMKALAKSDGSKTSVYDDVDDETFSKAAKAAAAQTLPSDEEIKEAVQMLKKGVEVWLTKEAEAPYVFDKSWGGLVNCGCVYHGKGDKGHCNNTFPHCPALASVNEDFGNGKDWW